MDFLIIKENQLTLFIISSIFLMIWFISCIATYYYDKNKGLKYKNFFTYLLWEDKQTFLPIRWICILGFILNITRIIYTLFNGGIIT